jgi:hypothetical protein
VIHIIEHIESTNLQELQMTSFTLTAPAATSSAPSFSLLSLIAAFFMLNLREKLDPEYTGADSDAAYYACGL